MIMMNELLKSTNLKSENGDATSTYDCELSRNNITVREFVEAVENSVNNRGQEFNEHWATVRMSIVGHSWFPFVAEYTIYGESSGSRLCDIELDGRPATFVEILSHYGKYVVDSCRWNGGWGAGGYYLKIKKEGTAV